MFKQSGIDMSYRQLMPHNTFHTAIKQFILIPVCAFLINAQEETVADTMFDSVSITQNKLDTTNTLVDTSLTSFHSDTTDTLADTAINSLHSDTSILTADTDTSFSEEETDTSFCNWKYPFWSFGAGWELGSLELFDLWKNGLQDELFIIRLLEQFDVDSNSTPVIIPADKEEPGVYNVTFPLSVFFTPFAFDKSFLSFGCSFSWIRKYSRTPVKVIDTVNVGDINFVKNYGDSIVNFESKLSLKTLTFSMRYNFLIPDIYFNIDKIRENYLILGISGSPLVILREWNTNSINHEETINSYGISAGWFTGIAAFRRLSSKSSLESGFIYAGSWQGRFMHNDHHKMINDINKSETNSSEVLQYVSHRFILYFNLIIGRKEYREHYFNQ